MAQRPANYVPFLAPKYNVDETNALKSAARGKEVTPVYDWFYRPEMQFSLFSLDMQGVLLREDDDTFRDVLKIDTPVGLYSADKLLRVAYRLDAQTTPDLERLGESRKLVFAIGDKLVQTEYSDDVMATIDPRTAAKMSPQDLLTLRLLQKGDEGNVLWEYGFQDLHVFLTNRDGTPISNIPKGRSKANARLLPEGSTDDVTWKLLDVDEGVKIELGGSTGQITVPDESGDGFVEIEARANEHLFTRVRVFVGCECETCGSPGGCTQRLGSVDLTFSLGTSEAGLSAGTLYVKQDSLSAGAYRRKSVLLSTMDLDTEALGDKDGLQQVVAPQSFVVLEDVGDRSYEVRFYPPSVRASDEKDPQTKLYRLNLPNPGNPQEGALVVWRISDPGDGEQGEKRLRVSELRGGSEKFTDYEFNAGVWSQSQGEGLRKEKREQRIDSPGRRTVRTTIGDAANGGQTVVERTYQTFAWGEELVVEAVDPDVENLTTITAYYENEDDYGSYRQIRHRIEPDGSWVRYGYDARRRVSTELRPWLDAPADPLTALASEGRVTQYSYAPVDSQDIANYLPEGGNEDDPGFSQPRVIAERIQGNLVSLTYLSIRQSTDGLTEISERCPTPSSSFGDGSCLRTTTRYYPALLDAVTSGKVRDISHPDGRVDSYTYERGVWTGSAFTTGEGRATRTTVTHGTTASPAGVPYKTTREVSIADEFGHAVRDENYIYDGSYTLVSWTTRQYDAEGHLRLATHSTGEQERETWGCCAVESSTDARGITTTFDRDALQRVRSTTRTGITTTYKYDAQGREREVTRSGGGLSVTSARDYDGAGRLRLSRDESGLQTTYGYTPDGRMTTVTRPGGFTETTQVHLDGQTKNVTGSAVVSQYFVYEVRGDGTRVTEVRSTRPDSPAYERTVTDMLGRTIRVERPGFGGTVETSTSTYDARGFLVRTTTTGLGATVYEYDALGNQVRSGLDVNANGSLDNASMDRIQESDTRFVSLGGHYWQQATQRTYTDDNGGAVKVVGTTRNRLTGLGNGLVSDQISIDLNGNETRSTVAIDAASGTETRVTDVPDSTYNIVTVATQGRMTSSTSQTGLTTTYGYDGLGRRTTVTDPRTGASETHYDTKGRVDYIQDAAGNRTAFGYDDATGRKTRETNALGKHSYFAYDASGRLIRTWGDVPYPVQYAYDAYGRRIEMHTYRTEEGWSSPTWPEAATGDVTRWHYDEATGLLTSKEDAAGKAVTYTYGPSSRLATRTWARKQANGSPLRTTYRYDEKTGELLTVDYHDDTPDVVYTHDRLGRQKTVLDGTGTRTFAYEPQSLQLATETMDGLTPAVITRYYDPAGVKGRSVGMSLGAGYATGYGYGTTGQMQSVSWTAGDVSDVAAYSRVPNSDLLAGYGTQSGLSVAYGYEPTRNLKTQVRNSFGGNVVSQYDYRYDAIGRRTSVENSGSAFTAAAFTNWEYDERNQVTGSNRYTGAFTATPNPANEIRPDRRDYGYDPIGNRENALGQDGTASVVYAANEVNQYEVIGQASSTYDEDGNLLKNGTKLLSYNAENQLTRAEVPGVSVSTYDYDYLGRRVRKFVDLIDGSRPDYVSTYVYNRWNVICEGTTTGPVTTFKYYVWGLDLARSLDNAAGIGGLLAAVNETSSHFFAYDAHGNVGQILDSATSGLAAHYEYDAFGAITTMSGAAAMENPYRFSTKRHDSETGLIYYGARYYDWRSGRWVSRDPKGVAGGLNLYGFAGNNAILNWDSLGHEFVDANGDTVYFLPDGVMVACAAGADCRYVAEFVSERWAAAGGADVLREMGASVQAIAKLTTDDILAILKLLADPCLLAQLAAEGLADAAVELVASFQLAFSDDVYASGYHSGRLWAAATILASSSAVTKALRAPTPAGKKITVNMAPPVSIPDGMNLEQFRRFSRTLRQRAGHISGDISVHGSRAAGTATGTSDIDVIIRVNGKRFDELIAERFGKPNPGSANERTMQHAIETGKIQAGEAGLRGLRKELEQQLDMPVDVSVIREGGPFDQGPFIPLQ